MNKAYTLLTSKSYALLRTAVLNNFNAAAQSIQITLTPSNYNGYHISCFGANTGSISTSVTGGTAPYTYTWSNAQHSQNIQGLVAGYYRLEVMDANNNIAETAITLTEPAQVELLATVHQYQNGYNISLYNACNGSIAVLVTGGTTPYSYLWSDNVATQNRSLLCAGNIYVDVTDANGCELRSEEYYLQQPERSDWTMNGNTGSSPATHFIGTVDNKDFVIKTNNAERMRIDSSGNIKVNGLAGSGMRMLYADSNGVLKQNVFFNSTLCTPAQPPAWFQAISGSYKALLTCPDVYVGIGTTNTLTDAFEVNGSTKLSGPVGIGISPQTNPAYALVVEGKIGAREVTVKAYPNTWPDYVFESSHQRMPLNELELYVAKHKHLPEIADAKTIETTGIDLGELQTVHLKKTEELYLYLFEINARIEQLEKENKKLLKQINSIK